MFGLLDGQVGLGPGGLHHLGQLHLHLASLHLPVLLPLGPLLDDPLQDQDGFVGELVEVRVGGQSHLTVVHYSGGRC